MNQYLILQLLRMRIVLFLLIIHPCFCHSQKYALLDKKMKVPILYTDSVTLEQVRKGFFPVKNESVDTLIANLLFVQDMLSKLQRSKAESFELHSASTIIGVNRVPYAYGDRYNISAQTSIGELNAVFRLTSSEDSNKASAKRVSNILDYLKSNKEFFKAPNEIVPKKYNVYVQTD